MQVPTQILCQALAAAARDKGCQLSNDERAAVYAVALREALRQRFLAVIRLAGYRGDAPESICAEWLDKYMADIPAFEAMLERYEKADGDPD